MAAQKKDTGTRQRERAVEVKYQKAMTNYRWIRIGIVAAGVGMALYMSDANTYMIAWPAGLWVWIMNGYETTFNEAPFDLLTISSTAAYIRVFWIVVFYLPLAYAYNCNRQNKPET